MWRLRSLAAVAFWVALAGLPARARAAPEQDGILFLFPYASRKTYNYLDVLNVSWTSPYEHMALWIFCNNGEHYVRTIDPMPAGDNSLFITLDWGADTPCYFNIRIADREGKGANSDKFDIDANLGDRETIGQFGTSSVGSATATLAATPAGSPVPETAVTLPDIENPGPSTGEQAGIAVGCAFGVILVAAVVAALYFGRRRRKKAEAAAAPAGMAIPGEYRYDKYRSTPALWIGHGVPDNITATPPLPPLPPHGYGYPPSQMQYPGEGYWREEYYDDGKRKPWMVPTAVLPPFQLPAPVPRELAGPSPPPVEPQHGEGRRELS